MLEKQKSNYQADMLQEANIEIDEIDDNDFDTSPKRYQLKFRYKDFSTDMIFPVYQKPMIDPKTKLDFVFETMIGRTMQLYLFATDETYREIYKNTIIEALKIKEEIKEK